MLEIRATFGEGRMGGFLRSAVPPYVVIYMAGDRTVLRDIASLARTAAQKGFCSNAETRRPRDSGIWLFRGLDILTALVVEGGAVVAGDAEALGDFAAALEMVADATTPGWHKHLEFWGNAPGGQGALPAGEIIVASSD